MREVEPDPPAVDTGARTCAKSLAGGLRREVSARNLARANAAGLAHETTRGSVPSVVYAPSAAGHGNFIEASYKRILADAAWKARLTKTHTAKRQAGRTGAEEEVRVWRELDTATSSDALLMNVFCYPGALGAGVSGARLRGLLGVEGGVRPEFGFRPMIPRVRGLVDRTEIDMRLGSLLVEAKLTESDFQTAPMRLVEQYRDFAEVFEVGELEVVRGGMRSYQLVRGVLAAAALDGQFCVLCDGRRGDLAEAWFQVMRAVKSYELRGRLRLVTWHEVAGVVGPKLRGFLGEKYGIGV